MTGTALTEQGIRWAWIDGRITDAEKRQQLLELVSQKRARMASRTSTQVRADETEFLNAELEEAEVLGIGRA